MTIAASLVLLLNAVFNVVAWPRFFTRVSNDPRARDASGRTTTFYRVHAILLVIALALAAASAVFAVLLFVG